MCKLVSQPKKRGNESVNSTDQIETKCRRLENKTYDLMRTNDIKWHADLLIVTTTKSAQTHSTHTFKNPPPKAHLKPKQRLIWWQFRHFTCSRLGLWLHFQLKLKNITCSIFLRLFANTTFKLGSFSTKTTKDHSCRLHGGMNTDRGQVLCTQTHTQPNKNDAVMLRENSACCAFKEQL